jgi:hypothetical protein
VLPQRRPTIALKAGLEEFVLPQIPGLSYLHSIVPDTQAAEVSVGVVFCCCKRIPM